MTGLERNADVVSMASYAPLFAHIDGWQWTPDLIWVNNLQSVGTPDYYVQKLFSLNRGTRVLPITMNNENIAGQDSLYASAATDDIKGEVILKIVNASAKPVRNNITLDGIKKTGSKAAVYSLNSGDLFSVNTFEEPQKIAPSESQLDVKGKKISCLLPPYSFTVIRLNVSPLARVNSGRINNANP
jgi:alpha-L-arabinofuranosidase